MEFSSIFQQKETIFTPYEKGMFVQNQPTKDLFLANIGILIRPFHYCEKTQDEVVKKAGAFFKSLKYLIPTAYLHCSSNVSNGNHLSHIVQDQKIPKEVRKITLMTWNICCHESGLSTVDYLSQPIDRIEKIADKILSLNPDVILLQEVCNYQAVDYLFQKFIDEKYNMCIDIAKGLMILTKFPMINVELYNAKEKAGSVCGQKGFLTCQIRISEDDYMIIGNTHLQAWDGEKFYKVRERQIKAINQYALDNLEKNFSNDNFIGLILGGDYNEAPIDEFGNPSKLWHKVEPIMTSNKKNPLWEKHEGKNLPGTWKGPRDNRNVPGSCLDHILCYPSESILMKYDDETEVVNPGDLSDHSILTTEVYLEKDSGK